MIRELELKDRENVLEVVKDIWEGDDYIPAAFDSWVSDSDCHFMGMWKDEALVGVANLRRLSPAVGWLEGMRIKPELQGKGYGRELAVEMMRLARNEGLKELYFSTYFDNLASIKINESLGFSRVAVFTNLELELKPSVDLEIELKYAGLQIGQEIPEIEA
ncbi:MAG TPA: GNAT family N-acetyltransferase, partial [Mesotoga infera]|nr:GNAT family N-acetyltransferase [Mesotoga infera]